MEQTNKKKRLVKLFAIVITSLLVASCSTMQRGYKFQAEKGIVINTKPRIYKYSEDGSFKAPMMSEEYGEFKRGDTVDIIAHTEVFYGSLDYWRVNAVKYNGSTVYVDEADIPSVKNYELMTSIPFLKVPADKHKLFWSRAYNHIIENSDMKIEINHDNMISCYNPHEGKYSYRITCELQDDGSYKYNVAVTRKYSDVHQQMINSGAVVDKNLRLREKKFIHYIKNGN